MPKNAHNPAAKIEHPAKAPYSGMPSWDDIRFFLACVNEGSFRKAANTLKTSDSTIARHIERLEKDLGSRLFDRLFDGAVLTAEGEALLDGAREMERAFFDTLKLEPPAHVPSFKVPSWDYIRIFLACVNEGSFRKAGLSLDLDDSTVSRRIRRLEKDLGSRLFDRRRYGVALTLEGEALLDGARKMERAYFDTLRRQFSDDDAIRGLVTISATEGLGSFWVTPKLVEFQQQIPQIMIKLACAMESADVLRLEADMAIQFERPTNQDLIVTKLGRLHVFPFASEKYLEIYGCPAGIEDMPNHRLLLQAAPNVDPYVWCEKLGLQSLDGIAQMVTNSSNALFYAVEKGAGIGALPTFAVALGAPVVAVDIGIKHHLDIWLTYHSGIRKTPRKAMLIDFIKSIFDSKTFPWFRDEFIHPNELAQALPKEASGNLGRGYFSVTPF